MNYLRFLKKIKNKLNLFIQKTQSKDISKIFDKIYVDKLWGKDELEDRLFSGEGSYDPKLTDNYVKVIEDFLLSLNNPSVLDLGCGDFEVGKRLIPYIFKYIAADVSSLVIEQNKKRFSETDVKFIHLDASSNELPSVDLIIVRQVLQHLSNDDIEKTLDKIKLSKSRFLCVTEHLPVNQDFIPNADKPTGVGIRLGLGSGVDIEKYPFNFPSKSCTELSNIQTIAEGLESRLVTKLYLL